MNTNSAKDFTENDIEDQITSAKKRKTYEANWKAIDSATTKTMDYLNKTKTTNSGREVRLVNRNTVNDVGNISKVTKESQIPIADTFKRRLPESARNCPTCGKTFVGYRKMLNHMEKYPTHDPIPLPEPKIDQLWHDLLLRTREMPRGLRAQRFFDEIVALIDKLRCLKRLISVNNAEENPLLRKYNFNSDLATLLSIPVGVNYVDENVLFSELNGTNSNRKNRKRNSYPLPAEIIFTDSISENIDNIVQENFQDLKDVDLENTSCFDLSNIDLIKFENN